MKSKILLTSALAFAISNTIQAEYSVNIPLEGNKIVFESPSVKGDIQLTPIQINRGESSNIIWNYIYADEINIENVGSYHSLTGSTSVSPLESTVYNVIIKSGDKSKTETLHLTVIQPNQNIVFNADSYKIGYGSNTNLNWNVTNANSVSIDKGIGDQSLSGSYRVTPTTDTTYTLTAKGFAGVSDESKTVNIVVVPNATINSFSVDNENISVGDTSTFTWNVLNAESVSLNGENVNKISGSKPVTFTTAGSFPYKLQTTSLSGLTDYSPTKTVNVYNAPIIASLTATPATVDAGQVVTLTFSTQYSSYNEINGTNMGSNPTYIVNPTTTTTYILTAKNEAGKTTTKPVTVTVQDWSATDPLYGEWTNVDGKVQYACGVWSPNPATVTTNTTFIQTSTCSTDQKRTRQDRLVSSATGQIKNNGTVVNETQTISQTANRPYGVTLAGWSGSTVSSCASWTPDPSTYNSGQVFTQTGLNCSLPQTRTRTENYIDHITGANIIVSTVNQQQTLTVTGTGFINGTRSATGTKPVEECGYSTNAPKTAWVILTGPLPTGGGGVIGTQIFYNGSTIYGGSSLATSMNIGGYNYYRSTMVNSLAYYVCRKPL